MLEKIGLPAKPSLRGNNWVVDASHCQGCSSQFTFINRKHHCRRCGGIFCNSCTQQRMVLRGQGDSPVRICEPCKQLEEAARFESRYGNKSRAARGSSKLTSKNEDEILNQILSNDVISRTSSSSASCSTTQQVSSLDSGGEINRSYSVNDTNLVQNEIGSSISPEELRKQAVDEKKRYKILKGEGKSEEAMKAFKRGKELERQADALEISIRKNRRKVLSSGHMAETQSKDGSKESGRKSKGVAQVVKEKDDLTAELRELGWTDMDTHDADKRSVGMSLEGELSSLLGDTSQSANKDVGTSGIDKTQVVAHKRKALTLKREGKLAEAKEELKKAKILEKQLEEQELMGGTEDSDDEISALIRSMDDDKQDDLLAGYEQDHGFDFNHLIGTADNLEDDRNLEVTDEDLMDPEIAATLKSLGWSDDYDNQQNNGAQIDKEALLSEIHALKMEALNHKRAGNVAEAMAQLKKAKLLERDLGSLEGENYTLKTQNYPTIHKGSISQNIPEKKDVGSKLAPKNRLMIQKELLALKKKALTLRREGRLDEAEEELKKGRILEQQLEDMDNASKAKDTQVTVGSKDPNLVVENFDIYEKVLLVEGEEDVTDQDMRDPTYISLLSNLGWKEDNEPASGTMKRPNENGIHSIEIDEPSVLPTGNISSRTSRRTKGEIQRELLALKRSALALRREGKMDEAEEVLSSAKVLETQVAEAEASFPREILVDSNRSKDEDNEFEDNKNNGSVCPPFRLSKEYDNHFLQIMEPSIIHMPSIVSSSTLRSKGEIQRELLGLKRKALALRREGKTDEAEEVLRSAKALETQIVELEASKKEIQVESNRAKDEITRAPLASATEEGDADDVTEEDMYDPALLLTLMNLGWKDEFQPVAAEGEVSKNASVSSVYSTHPSVVPSSSSISAGTARGKGEARRNHVGGEVDPLDKIVTLGNVGKKQGSEFTPPHQSGNIMDLPTGDGRNCSQLTALEPRGIVNFGLDVSSLPQAHVQAATLSSSSRNLRSKEHNVSFGSDASCQAQGHARVDSLTSTPENLGSKVNVTTKMREEIVAADEKQHTGETNSQGLTSQNNQSSLRQEVLARKRKAVALKREGKLLEAREELRQAKLLEKSLKVDTTVMEPGTCNVSTSMLTAPPVRQKEPGTSNLATKTLSGRDRFKLQQESLSHKRKALKLRREGRMEEAEAEFELAKALEVQLEEIASQSSAKSEPADDVVVEDLLDPQLLSALRAIGIEDANVASKGPERLEPVEVILGKGENVIQERIQLEEQMKAEKVKAVNLKRAGKQAEALEAFRRAKLFEKRLNSLASS
eukprot:XP_015574291.1 uncharacterized protein LOC107261206 [Ricinus communis]